MPKNEKNAEAKIFLKQAQKLDRMINNKIAEKEQWLAMAKGMGSFSAGERVQSSGSQQKMADNIEKYVDIDREIDEIIDKLIETKKDILNVIEQLNVNEYDLLHKVYIQGFELYEVSTMMDKSYSWCTTVHGKALEDVQRILDDRKALGPS